MHEQTVKWGKELGLELDPGIRVDKLSVAEQQVVEIVKVFSQDPKLIILDEPTSSLSDNEIEKLFAIIERLKKEGSNIHLHLPPDGGDQRIGDGGTILRDGKFITTIEDVKLRRWMRSLPILLVVRWISSIPSGMPKLAQSCLKLRILVSGISFIMSALA